MNKDLKNKEFNPETFRDVEPAQEMIGSIHHSLYQQAKSIKESIYRVSGDILEEVENISYEAEYAPFVIDSIYDYLVNMSVIRKDFDGDDFD
ncbi:MAG: hypothetical protein LBR26_09600 [Prevotella sp.]|jgi:hypothetical protein|nr:hypothetical protein [Prevotella sp.]